MYTISAASNKIEKDFEKLKNSLSEKQQEKMFTVLAKSPKSTQSSKDVLNKVEKKGKFWQYYATGGDRIIYDIVATKN